MPSTSKKPESMHDIIFEAVTKKREAVQETARRCKQLFKQKNSPTDPKILTQLEEELRARQDVEAITKQLKSSKAGANPEALAELGKSVGKKREHYNNYIQHFLPALLREIIQSKELKPEKIKEIVGIISDAIKQGGEEKYENFQLFLLALKTEITDSKELDQTKKTEIEKIIMGLITLDAVSKNDNKDSKIEKQPINSIKEEIPVSSTGMTENNVESPMTQDQTQQKLESLTEEEVCASDSDSGIDSPRKSEESSRSPVSSRRSSISSAEEKNDSQKGDTGNQMQPEQTAEEEPQVSSQCVTLGSREKESMDTNSQTTQMTGSQAKDSMQPEEKKDKKNVITTAQKLPVNEKKGEVKQPNNRNLHTALVAGCALSTIGCIVAGAMTSGLIGAGLLAMAAVFAIAAVAELHSNFLSSKLTSINVSPLVNDKELTACSRL